MLSDGPPAEESKPPRRAPWALSAVLLGVFLLAWLVHLAVTLQLNYPIEFGEGTYLQLAWLSHMGQTLYPDYAVPPYWICPYTPLYLSAAGLLQGATPGYVGGRLLSFLAIATCLGLPVWAGKKSRRFALAFIGLFLVNPLIFNMSCLFRSDCLALMFAFAALVLIETQATAYPSALCCIAAIWTKQSFLAAPLAICLSLALSDRKRLWQFVLAMTTLLACSGGLAQLVTEGRFWRVQVAFLVHWPPPETSQMLFYLKGFVPTELLLLPALLWSVRQSKYRLWTLYLVINIFWLRGCGRPGGYYNYLCELHLAMAYLAALAMAENRFVWLLPLHMLSLGSWLALPPTFYSPKDYIQFETMPVLLGQQPGYVRRLQRESQQVAEALARHPGPVLAENLGKTVVHGRLSAFCDLFMYSVLFRMNSLDISILRNWIRARGPAIILLQRRLGEGSNRVPEQVLRDIEENYQVETRIQEEWVMLPR